MGRWRSGLAVCALALSLAALSPGGARADAAETPYVIETVRLGALDLIGKHVRPDGAGLATILIVHDTLSGFGAETIANLQTSLAGRGWSSLAINLSLNESGRMEPLPCNVRHTHRHDDALKEIDVWVDWLLGQGLGPVMLSGHGRGAAQAAWSLAQSTDDKVAAAAFLAPLGWSPAEADAEYRARYQDGIAALLTQIAGRKPEEMVDNVPFLHCGAVSASKASIESYYGAQPMRDTPTALDGTSTPTLALLPDVGEGAPETGVASRFAELSNPAVVVQTIEGADAQFTDEAFATAVDAIDAYLRSIVTLD